VEPAEVNRERPNCGTTEEYSKRTMQGVYCHAADFMMSLSPRGVLSLQEKDELIGSLQEVD